MKKKGFISVITYVTDDSDEIKDFIPALDTYLFNNFELYEIIIVNNFSKDNIINTINSLSYKLKKNINIINLAWKHDIEIAMLAGAELSIGDFIFEIDSIHIDFPLSTISELFDKALTGYDIVSATPKNDTKYFSKIFYKLLRKVSYLKLNLNTESIRLVSRRALNRVLSFKEKIRYRKALYATSGFPRTLIIYESTNKNNSNKKKEKLSDRIAMSIDLLFVLSNIGLKFTIMFSILFLFISVLIGVYSILAHFIFDKVVTGWTTTMLFLSFGFSGIFFIFGILVKYITIILQEVQNKPEYVTESVIQVKAEKNHSSKR